MQLTRRLLSSPSTNLLLSPKAPLYKGQVIQKFAWTMRVPLPPSKLHTTTLTPTCPRSGLIALSVFSFSIPLLSLSYFFLAEVELAGCALGFPWLIGMHKSLTPSYSLINAASYGVLYVSPDYAPTISPKLQYKRPQNLPFQAY